MTLSKCTVNVLVVFFFLFVCELLAGHRLHFVKVYNQSSSFSEFSAFCLCELLTGGKHHFVKVYR